MEAGVTDLDVHLTHKLDLSVSCHRPESLVLGCGLTWSHGHAVLPAGAGPGGRRGARGVAGGIPVGPGHVAPDKDGGVPTLPSGTAGGEPEVDVACRFLPPTPASGLGCRRAGRAC